MSIAPDDAEPFTLFDLPEEPDQGVLEVVHLAYTSYQNELEARDEAKVKACEAIELKHGPYVNTAASVYFEKLAAAYREGFSGADVNAYYKGRTATGDTPS